MPHVFTHAEYADMLFVYGFLCWKCFCCM